MTWGMRLHGNCRVMLAFCMSLFRPITDRLQPRLQAYSDRSGSFFRSLHEGCCYFESTLGAPDVWKLPWLKLERRPGDVKGWFLFSCVRKLFKIRLGHRKLLLLFEL